MGECLFETNGLDNDNDLRRETRDDAQSAHQKKQHKSLKPTRPHTVDVGGKWFGCKKSRNDRDSTDYERERQPPNRGQQISSTKEATWSTLHEYITKGISRISSALLWEVDGDPAMPQDQGKTETHPIVTREIADPPLLIDEDGEWEEEGCERTLIVPSNVVEQQASQFNSEAEIEEIVTEYIDPPPLINEDDVEGESISPLKVTTHISTQIETGLKTKEGEGAKLRPPIRTSLDSTRWDKLSSNLNPVGRQEVYNENDYTYAERVEAAEARILSALDIQEVESRLNLDGQWHWLDSSYNEEDEDEETITSASDSSMEKFIKDMNEHTERRIRNPKQVILEFESIEASRRKEEELCLPSNYKYRRIETFFAKRNNMKEKKAPTNNVVQLATRLNRKSRNETIVTTKRRRKIIRTHRHKHRWAKRSKNECSKKTREVFKDSIGCRQRSARLICNRSYVVQKIGIAWEMIALLRRCLYPKRDVIRWNL